MKVLLVDDHRLLLEGLTNLLQAHGIEVADTAVDGLEAIKKTKALRPDVILMDIRMPRCDGLEATRRIKAAMPEAKVVILTTSTEDSDLFEAVKSGACGYLLKSMDAGELVTSLEQAQHGVPPFSPGLAVRLIDEFARLAGGSVAASPPVEQPPPDAGQLTPRQCEVLDLVSRGLSYKEIGAQLNLSPRTIKYHMAEIMAKLHLQHRAQVLAYAGRLGLGLDEPI
jgi:DNA-binding NarL/FixJ family response regulator